MKKIILNVCFLCSLMLTGVCFMSCSKDTELENSNQEPVGVEKTYTLTVNASKNMGALTRALELTGSTLNAYWADGEEINVLNAEGTSIGTLTPQSTGSASTTLKGSITTTGLSAGNHLTLAFPRITWNYSGQNGELSKIANTYDYAQADVTISSINGDNITTSDATFINQQAIVKFTLMDKVKRTAITSEYLNISDSENHLVFSVNNGNVSYGSCAIYKPSGKNDNVYYVALRGVSNSNLTFTSAMMNSESYTHYTYSKDNITFVAGKYYEVTMYMSGGYDKSLDISSGNITVPSGKHYKVTGTSNNYTIALGASYGEQPAYVTLSGVTISNGTNNPIRCDGEAMIILEDGKTNTLTSTNSTLAAIQLPRTYSQTNTLTIEGNTGILKAYGGTNAPGIGSCGTLTYGNLIINGGVIEAKCNAESASNYGAGIGTGSTTSCTIGNITINGGTITATTGGQGAGIGCSPSNTCGNIVINGGNVWAKGGFYSAGIGGSLDSNHGDITIGASISQVVAIRGHVTGSPELPQPQVIGNGYRPGNACGTVTINGSLNKAVSTTNVTDDTWTLTQK